jgi:hypothetical protein
VCAGNARMLRAMAGAHAHFALGDALYPYSLIVEDKPDSVDPLLDRLVLSNGGVQSLLLMRWVQMG